MNNTAIKIAECEKIILGEEIKYSLHIDRDKYVIGIKSSDAEEICEIRDYFIDISKLYSDIVNTDTFPYELKYIVEDFYNR